MMSFSNFNEYVEKLLAIGLRNKVIILKYEQ